MATKDKKDAGHDDIDVSGGEPGDAGGKAKKKLIIIVVAALLLLGGGGAGLYFSGLLGGNSSTSSAGMEAGHGEAGKAGDGKPGQVAQGPDGSIYFSFPDNYKFIVNLNTGGKQTSFLKADIALELADSKALEAVNANLPRIMDVFNTYLRELRPSDLQGSAGIYRLREEMLMRVNRVVHPSKVNDVLFKEIIVQ